MTMSIAITGGAGFIGSVLTRRLVDAGEDVRILDIQASKAFPDLRRDSDVTDEAAMIRDLEGVDVIYHLAAEHRDDVQPIQKYYDVNVGGAQNVVAAAEAHNINTIIFTSTVAVYGLDAGDPKTGSVETDPANPFNDYGQSKLDSEKVFEAWAAKDPRRKLVTLRLVATFGPDNRGNIYTLMDQIARGKFVMVGSGRNHKSIAYVENVAAFLQHCMSLPPGLHTYNYADKPDLNMREMVADIRSALGLPGMGPHVPYAIGLAGGMTFDVAAKLTGRTFPISKIRVQKFCANTIVNADKVQETGFQAPYSLSEGLKTMIEAEFPTVQKNAA